MTAIDIAGLRALAQAATPGPWRWGEWRSEGFNQVVAEHGVVADCDFNDGRFIAAANPATVLALCDALEAAEATIVELRELVSHEDEVWDSLVEHHEAETAEQAREIERLREMVYQHHAYRDGKCLVCGAPQPALSGAGDVSHGIMMAVHGPGGVNSQGTAGEAQE